MEQQYENPLTPPCPEQPVARLRRLAASVVWDGKADHAASFRLYFQLSVVKILDKIPVLLDAGREVERFKIISVQHTRLPLPGLLNQVEKENTEVNNASCSTETTPEQSSKHDVELRNLNTLTDRQPLPSTGNAYIRISQAATQRSPKPALDALLKEGPDKGYPPCQIHHPPSTSTPYRPNTPETIHRTFFYGNRGIFPPPFCKPLRPLLNTNTGNKMSTEEEEWQRLASSLASISEEATSNDKATTPRPSTPEAYPQSPQKHHRQISSTCSSPTRIPAPVWKDIVPILAQHKPANTNPVTNAPKLQPSALMSPKTHEKSRSSSPLRASWRSSDPANGSLSDVKSQFNLIPQKGLRRPSSTHSLSTVAESQQLPQFSKGRRRSRSIGQISRLVDREHAAGPNATPLAEQGDGLSPVLTGSEFVEKQTVRGRKREEDAASTQGNGVGACETAFVHHEQPAPAEGPKPAHSAKKEMATITRDEHGRLCVARRGGFEPGHYQIDLELSKKPTPVDENSTQNLEVPPLEPTLLKGHVFHDGKMFLQITGPWSEGTLRISARDFLDHQILSPTTMIGSFKLAKIPLLQIQRKSGLHYPKTFSTRMLTKVVFSTSLHNIAKVAYKAKIRCTQPGVEETFADHVVLEFGISNAFVKGGKFFLDKGKSTVEVEPLSREERATAPAEAVVSIFRSMSDFMSPLVLRFYMLHALSDDTLSTENEIPIAAVRPMHGISEAEVIHLHRPSLPLRIEPSSLNGRTWDVRDIQSESVIWLARRQGPPTSEAPAPELPRIRLTQLQRISTQIPGFVRTSGKPVVLALAYKIGTTASMFRCDMDFYLSREDWSRSIEVDTRSWEPVAVVVDGTSYFLENAKDKQKMVAHGKWTLRATHLDKWANARVHMFFMMAEETGRALYESETGKGFLPLPKIVDAWVWSGTVESNLESCRPLPLADCKFLIF